MLWGVTKVYGSNEAIVFLSRHTTQFGFYFASLKSSHTHPFFFDSIPGGLVLPVIFAPAQNQSLLCPDDLGPDGEPRDLEAWLNGMSAASYGWHISRRRC